MRQSSSFLLLCIYYIDPKNKYVNIIKKELYHQLDLQDQN